MTKNLYCFDLDSTLTHQEILPLIANEVGLKHEIEVLTKLTLDGIISFEDSLRLRFAILKTIPISIIHDIIKQVKLFDDIIYFIQNNITSCYIITGNIDVWIAPLMQQIGCPYYCSTTISKNNTSISLNYVMNKAHVINQLRQQFPKKQIIAIGDSLNDYPMFKSADIGIALGLVHKPSSQLVNISNYVIYDEKDLCKLLSLL